MMSLVDSEKTGCPKGGTGRKFAPTNQAIDQQHTQPMKNEARDIKRLRIDSKPSLDEGIQQCVGDSKVPIRIGNESVKASHRAKETRNRNFNEANRNKWKRQERRVCGGSQCGE
jgi:hypothetical protein